MIGFRKILFNTETFNVWKIFHALWPIHYVSNLFFFICLFFQFSTSIAQSVPVNERTRILFLLDASGSMHQPWSTNNEPRIISAKRILNEIMDSLERNNKVELALRVYGHQSPLGAKDCKDTKLEAGFSRNNISFIRSKLKNITPRGITPIAYSLQQSASDFPDNQTRNIIILMTDGEESCKGDPCAVAYELEKKGIVLKHFAIGIGITEDAAKTFQCFSSFYNVSDQQSFKNVLTGIINKVTNNNTSQVYILDKNQKPTETDINMTFYDAYNQMLKYNFYQTFDGRGQPDTLTLDPITDYNITFHTLPAIEKKAVVIQPNQHNIIEVNAPQGFIDFMFQGVLPKQELAEKIKCVVRAGKKIINVQSLNTKEKYLAGNYEIEVLTLPRTRMNNTKVMGNATTKIEIVTPGMLNLQKRFEVLGGIFVEEKNNLEKIYELSSGTNTETVALQPGKYFVIYRMKNAKSMHNTKTLAFEIKSGDGVNLILQ
jgi:Ca-activated chloride channel family protein